MDDINLWTSTTLKSPLILFQGQKHFECKVTTLSLIFVCSFIRQFTTTHDIFLVHPTPSILEGILTHIRMNTSKYTVTNTHTHTDTTSLHQQRMSTSHTVSLEFSWIPSWFGFERSNIFNDLYFQILRRLYQFIVLLTGNLNRFISSIHLTYSWTSTLSSPPVFRFLRFLSPFSL